MVRARHKHQKSPGTARGGVVYGIMLGLLVLISLSGVGTVWVHRNRAVMRSRAAAVRRVLEHDRRLGVPRNQVLGVQASLDRVVQARLLVIPKFWLGPLAGVPARVAQVSAQAHRLVGAAQRNERREALFWGRRLMRVEGRFSSVSAAQLRALAAGNPSIGRLTLEARTWRKQATRWQAAMRRLAHAGGGLVGLEPYDVVTSEAKLSRRLAARGPYWQGAATASLVLGQTRRYRRLSPLVQLKEHAVMMDRLERADRQLRPPTQAELEAVLAGVSGGLVHNQPKDVASALAMLKTRMASAEPNWAGYPKAEAAIQGAEGYLDSPLLSQISQHGAVLAAIKAAFEELRAPASAAAAPGNPWRASVVGYLKTRQSVISIAVFNAKTRSVTTLNSQTSYVTASIVKATIMAALLWQSQNTGHPLTATDKALMTTMIEDSDNASATSLWYAAGAAPGIASFLRAAGLSHTIPGANGYWGLTETTVLDQVRLVKLLSYPNSLLTPASQAYADYLMEHIVSWEDWGVSTGPLGRATVMLKNGWLPISGGWEINSIGHVSGDGRNYVIALLSRNNPTEAYGIQTLDTVSALIWKAL